MDFLMIERIINATNLILELASMVFITFVFFDLVVVDREIQLTQLSEKFEKLKRYDQFKSSLIFLVLYLYSMFFSKVSQFLEFPSLASSIFSLIGTIFLLLFTFKLYQIISKYVPKDEKNNSKD